MIYKKNSFVPLNHNRYEQAWEYMFVFSKRRPKTWNPLLVSCLYPGVKKWRGNSKAREASYAVKPVAKYTINKEEKQHENVFVYDVGHNDTTRHNAPFPEKLAADHILSWSNEGDTVFDPFSGSGTTCKMAKELGRHWIGIEINPEYIEISSERMRQEVLFFES